MNPKIIFADEPTGNLDSKTTLEILRLMQRVVREQNQTLLMVTHDNNLASYADRQFHIVDGKIVRIVEKEETDGEHAEDETAVGGTLDMAETPERNGQNQIAEGEKG